MPLVRIDIIEGHTDKVIAALADIVQQVMISTRT
jgi:phenylpyruvate tautomerase PptA (4-oxalocrotonate tautomerase family)